MCMGCMANADFVVTSGILGAASVRVGLRRFLPTAPWRSRKVTDEEASAFVASLAPPTDDATRGVTAPADGQPELTPATVGVLDAQPEPMQATAGPVDTRPEPTPATTGPVDCAGPVDTRPEPTPATAGAVDCRTDSTPEESPADEAPAPSRVLTAR